MKSSKAGSKDWKKTYESEVDIQNSDFEKNLREKAMSRRTRKTDKKWNKTQIIFLLNILLLMVLIVMYRNQNEKPAQYTSTTLDTADIGIRMSIGEEAHTYNSIISLTITNKKKEPVSIPLQSGLAVITIFHDGKPILLKKIASDMKRLVLGNEESKTFIEAADASAFDNILSAGKKKRFYFLRSSGKDIFRADCTVLFEKPENFSLNFSHGVRK